MWSQFNTTENNLPDKLKSNKINQLVFIFKCFLSCVSPLPPEAVVRNRHKRIIPIEIMIMKIVEEVESFMMSGQPTER